MTPLEAAKALAALPMTVSVDDGDAGHGEFGCCNQRDYLGHAANCPWLAMPRIVAALEAAERSLSALRDLPLEAKHIQSGYTKHILDGVQRELLTELKGDPS
jgi:hypothetical protein